MKKPKSEFNWIKTEKSLLPRGRWFVEYFTKGELHAHKTEEIIETSETYFQKATLIKTPTFGKVLVIDNETQSSQYDEAFYHESLVCPALLAHHSPETALILGGGEGATAREILNSKGIKKTVMADIDHSILGFAARHLAAWHRGAFRDPRLCLLVQDAKKYVENTQLKFDLIYCDLPSPIKKGPATRLYTLEFYRALKATMNTGAIFTTQAGPGTPLQFELHAALRSTLAKVFKFTGSYSTFIPSYDMPWTWLYCTDSTAAAPHNLKAEKLDTRIAARLRRPLKYSDGLTITGAFILPKYYRKKIKACRRIVTAARPVFFTTSRCCG